LPFDYRCLARKPKQPDVPRPFLGRSLLRLALPFRPKTSEPRRARGRSTLPAPLPDWPRATSCKSYASPDFQGLSCARQTQRKRLRSASHRCRLSAQSDSTASSESCARKHMPHAWLSRKGDISSRGARQRLWACERCRLCFACSRRNVSRLPFRGMDRRFLVA
jgi:hypothetical protein